MSTPTDTHYLVGIDLGTTHTVVSFADLSDGAASGSMQLFEIEQLIAPGEVAKRPVLPSFRYHPAAGELPEAQLVLPWKPQCIPGDEIPYVVGEIARDLGSKVEGRLIASAKSWLSHDKVDRSAPILPWASADDVEKVSPVVASASYLLHVKCAWNHEHPDEPLERQEVVLTVPASFDEAARALTMQAAELAGLPDITLLEEPQAVCYDWYHRQADQLDQVLGDIRLLFVVDVGGGTTDLSLIKVEQKETGLALTRIAVGDHLMLGGDNVDLALARMAEQRIIKPGGAKLSAASLSQLIQQSRMAKEVLLGDAAPESTKVTLLGGGGRLIGGARSAEFSQEEVRLLALDGFFPLVSFGELPAKRSAAVVEFGLPYAPDPGVSRYLSQFLMNHQSGCREALMLDKHEVAIPDAVLFNGGVFGSELLTGRAVTLLSQWRGEDVTRLDNHHPDLAVAYGAVAFGLSRRTKSMRIGGGSARTYFLCVENAAGEQAGVCLLPKGIDEGNEVALADRQFELQVNQPVQFLLATYSGDQVFQPGQIVSLSEYGDAMVRLPPLVAALDHDDQRDSVKVNLITRLTEIGTIDIQCQAENSNQRWKVEFQLRKQLQASHPVQSLPANFSQAVAAIEAVYGSSNKNPDPKSVKQLRQQIEKSLGPRDEWDTALARALFDEFWQRRKRRRRSQSHERLWFNLSGYCMRPGFGYPADDWRVDQVWSLFQQGLQFDKENQSWADWWTFWRRCAGGLDEKAQQLIYKRIAKYLNPAMLRNLKLKADIKNKSYEDMVKLVASLERLPLTSKVEVAGWLLKRLKKSSETQTSWWALGRIAARTPFYASTHNVVPPQQAETWLRDLLKQDWKKNQNAAFAAVMMASVTSDRTRDVSDVLRQDVCERLVQSKSPVLWQQMVTEFIELDNNENKRIFGEALPVGIKLIAH